jgi:hypothetical protein
LRALPLGAARAEAVAKLATKVAELLRRQPDVTRPGIRPDDLLYNLFLLCAGLDQPVLAAPLREVYERLKAGECALTEEIRDALLSALIRNQEGTALEDEVWNPMLETGRHGWLPGNAFAGLLGLARMRPGDPSVAARGLRKLAALLEAVRIAAAHSGTESTWC